MVKRRKQGKKCPDGFIKKEILLYLCGHEKVEGVDVRDHLRKNFGVRERKGIDTHLNELEKQKLIKTECLGRGYSKYYFISTELSTLIELVDIFAQSFDLEKFIKTNHFEQQIPLLIDHFNEKIKAQGLPELTERERMCFKEYGLKYSPSLAKFLAEDRDDYRMTLEGRSFVLHNNMKQMMTSPFYSEMILKAADKMIHKKYKNQHKNQPTLNSMLKDMKGAFNEIISIIQKQLPENIVPKTWLIVVNCYVEFDMMYDRIMKDNVFWQMMGRYYPFSFEKCVTPFLSNQNKTTESIPSSEPS